MNKQNYESHFQESCSRRDAFWKSVGKMDADVLAPMINPAFAGGPRWPSMRQAFATVRCPTTTIIASDGLSDPFDDQSENSDGDAYNGFGLEIYAETPGDLADVKGSWQFDLVYQTSQNAAHQGDLRAILETLGYVTTELHNVRVPKEFQNAEGRVGAMLGLPSDTVPAQVALSLETVSIVNVKLLTLRELEYVVGAGKEGRAKLAELFIKQGNASYSDLDRRSVI
jgi:hypothetical protein